MMREGDILWTPSADYQRRTNIAGYMRWLTARDGVEFSDYEALWRWSVADIERFWRTLWDYFELQSPTPFARVLDSHEMPGARWFPGAQINYAREILRRSGSDGVALSYLSELRPLGQVSWAELGEASARVAHTLRALGVQAGERVVSFMPNIPETVIAFLGAARIGAIWSNCAPEFGIKSALDRFQQVEPAVLFAVDGYRYGGRDFDRRADVATLIAALPTLRRVITVAYLNPEVPFRPLPDALIWDDVQATTPTDEGAAFADTDFSAPLWIVYSSGTTGLPKPIVHGHGGVLLELLKFCSFHMNLGPQSVTFMFTTSGWITWNVLTGCLLTGSTIVLYDGNPTYPNADVLWRMAADTGTTFFGASPAFVSLMMDKGVVPRAHYDLTALEGIFCTGSPASPEHFAWFYANVKDDLWINSASGGTDISSSFVGGCPLLPVRAGEIQTRFLGADVHAFDDEGHEIFDAVGEFVVTQPLPSMPLFLWNDPDNRRYRETYFEQYPGVWRHGDYFVMNSRGGCYVRGRSDATLNRYGVRMGTAEIYRTIQALPEVADSVVVNLDLPGGGFFMPLFVKLRPQVVLDARLEQTLNEALRQYSPRHVPDAILVVGQIPYTRTGKKMEVPVRRILMGLIADVSDFRDSMTEPDALDFFLSYAAETTLAMMRQG